MARLPTETEVYCTVDIFLRKKNRIESSTSMCLDAKRRSSGVFSHVLARSVAMLTSPLTICSRAQMPIFQRCLRQAGHFHFE